MSALAGGHVCALMTKAGGGARREPGPTVEADAASLLKYLEKSNSTTCIGIKMPLLGLQLLKNAHMTY